MACFLAALGGLLPNPEPTLDRLERHEMIGAAVDRADARGHDLIDAAHPSETRL
jgi:hypothetical protein